MFAPEYFRNYVNNIVLLIQYCISFTSSFVKKYLLILNRKMINFPCCAIAELKHYTLKIMRIKSLYTENYENIFKGGYSINS